MGQSSLQKINGATEKINENFKNDEYDKETNCAKLCSIFAKLCQVSAWPTLEFFWENFDPLGPS